MNTSKIVPVILSGGSGTRLWPLSTQARPKQFHAIANSQAMIAATAARVSDAGHFAQPIVIGSAGHIALLREHLDESNPQLLILEPFGRNTAAAIALAALTVSNTDPEAMLLILPADHAIPQQDLFIRDILAASASAQAGNIVLFGIQPTEAHTGYGYIKSGDATAHDRSYRIERFTEKPDAERARQFLDAGGYSWNSGIFLARADVLLSELERHVPEVLANTRQALEEGIRDGHEVHLNPRAFEAVPSVPFDVAVMEKTDRGIVLSANFDWSDVGCWAAVHATSDKTADGNSVEGNCHVAAGTRNSLVRNLTDIPVFVAGLEDAIIVVSETGIVVASQRQAQDVKQATQVFSPATRSAAIAAAQMQAESGAKREQQLAQSA